MFQKKIISSTARIASTISIKGGTGKSQITANLGVELAKRGYRTCLIDNDSGANSLDTILRGQDPESRGIEDQNVQKTLFDFLTSIQGKVSIQDVIVSSGHPKLDFIQGISTKDWTDKLNSHLENIHILRLLKLIHDLFNKYEFILLDTSPGADKQLQVILANVQKIFMVIDGSDVAMENSFEYMDQLLNNEEYVIQKNALVVVLNNIGEQKAELFGKLIKTEAEKYIGFEDITVEKIPWNKDIDTRSDNGEWIFMDKPSWFNKQPKQVIKKLADILCEGLKPLNFSEWLKTLPRNFKIVISKTKLKEFGFMYGGKKNEGPK